MEMEKSKSTLTSPESGRQKHGDPSGSKSKTTATAGKKAVAEKKAAREYPVSFRGTLRQLDAEGNCEFKAVRHTGSTQLTVAQSGQSKLYRTTGQRAPQMVAHLSVSADSADPAAQLHQQLGRLTKGIVKRQPKPLDGVRLLEGKECIVVHNLKQQRLQVVIDIDLTQPQLNLQSEIIRHLQTINQCLAINRESLIPRKS